MIEITAIVPTRNRAGDLRKMLASVARQTLEQSRFEIIVIDNGSSDETADVCREMEGHFLNFRYFYAPEPGLHVGRNMGMLQSRAEFLVYADDDIEATPTWLASIVEGFFCSDVVLIGGSDLPGFEKNPPSWVTALWRRVGDSNVLVDFSLVDHGDHEKEIDPGLVFGCNFAIRKSILLKAGGFHPDGMPDNMLMYRGDGETHVSNYIKMKGYRTLFIPAATVYHRVPANRMTLSYVEKIAYRNGISDAYSKIREKRIKKLSFFLKMRYFYYKLRAFLSYDRLARRKILCHVDGELFLLNRAFHDVDIMNWICKEKYF